MKKFNIILRVIGSTLIPATGILLSFYLGISFMDNAKEYSNWGSEVVIKDEFLYAFGIFTIFFGSLLSILTSYVIQASAEHTLLLQSINKQLGGEENTEWFFGKSIISFIKILKKEKPVYNVNTYYNSSVSRPAQPFVAEETTKSENTFTQNKFLFNCPVCGSPVGASARHADNPKKFTCPSCGKNLELK